jgi:hypothetical protein
MELRFVVCKMLIASGGEGVRQDRWHDIDDDDETPR